MRLLSVAMLFTLFCLGGGAQACGPEVNIRFAEASPDRFRIDFVRGEKLRLIELEINLNGSAAGVVFDDYDGLPMQGPQPNPSGVQIRSVKYGNQTARLTFDDFFEKRRFDFISDLDDRGLGSDPDQNHVYDEEIAGASAKAVLIGENGKKIEITGQFDKRGQARLGERACV